MIRLTIHASSKTKTSADVKLLFNRYGDFFSERNINRAEELEEIIYAHFCTLFQKAEERGDDEPRVLTFTDGFFVDFLHKRMHGYCLKCVETDNLQDVMGANAPLGFVCLYVASVQDPNDSLAPELMSELAHVLEDQGFWGRPLEVPIGRDAKASTVNHFNEQKLAGIELKRLVAQYKQNGLSYCDLQDSRVISYCEDFKFEMLRYIYIKSQASIYDGTTTVKKFCAGIQGLKEKIQQVIYNACKDVFYKFSGAETPCVIFGRINAAWINDVLSDGHDYIAYNGCYDNFRVAGPIIIRNPSDGTIGIFTDRKIATRDDDKNFRVDCTDNELIVKEMCEKASYKSFELAHVAPACTNMNTSAFAEMTDDGTKIAKFRADANRWVFVPGETNMDLLDSAAMRHYDSSLNYLPITNSSATWNPEREKSIYLKTKFVMAQESFVDMAALDPKNFLDFHKRLQCKHCLVNIANLQVVIYFLQQIEKLQKAGTGITYNFPRHGYLKEFFVFDMSIFRESSAAAAASALYSPFSSFSGNNSNNSYSSNNNNDY
jgi:hypothetical protein